MWIYINIRNKMVIKYSWIFMYRTGLKSEPLSKELMWLEGINVICSQHQEKNENAVYCIMWFVILSVELQ
jgi:hypothetical protein